MRDTGVLPTVLVAAALLTVPAVALPAAEGTVLPPAVPGVAEGFVLHPLAQVPSPTALAFGPGLPEAGGDGPDLFAATLPGDVVRIELTWTGAGPVAVGQSAVASGFNQPLGLAFDPADGALYVSDSHPGAESGRTDGVVYRVDVADGSRTAVVDGLPNGRHNTNHLRFGPDDRLHLANGNPNDDGVEGGPADVLPYSGAILSVNATEVAASSAVLHWEDADGEDIPPDEIATHPRNDDFNDKVDVLAFGFRNVFGVAFGPDGTAYTATNGADEPSSQDALYKIAPGTDYGFPFCFNGGLPGATGDDVTKLPNPVHFPDHDCSPHPPADALLGWHVCATGLDFPTGGIWSFPGDFRRSVYVGECGAFFVEDLVAKSLEQGPSTHNTGHKVARVELDCDGDPVEVHDFVTGLALPTDVLFGPDGAMYIAELGDFVVTGQGAVHRVASLVPSLGSPCVGYPVGASGAPGPAPVGPWPDPGAVEL